MHGLKVEDGIVGLLGADEGIIELLERETEVGGDVGDLFLGDMGLHVAIFKENKKYI